MLDDDGAAVLGMGLILLEEPCSTLAGVDEEETEEETLKERLEATQTLPIAAFTSALEDNWQMLGGVQATHWFTMLEL